MENCPKVKVRLLKSSFVGGCHSWIIDLCPYCGERHSHGAGNSIKNVDRMLGHRVAHCTSLPRSDKTRQYELVWDGQCKVS